MDAVLIRAMKQSGRGGTGQDFDLQLSSSTLLAEGEVQAEIYRFHPPPTHFGGVIGKLVGLKN